MPAMEPPSSVRGCGGLGDRFREGPESLEPVFEPTLVGEEHEQRIVARQRAFLFVQRRLIDGLGDDAGGARRAGEDEDQAAAPDGHRDVDEDAAQPLVGLGRRGRDVLAGDVGVAVAVGAAVPARASTATVADESV